MHRRLFVIGAVILSLAGGFGGGFWFSQHRNEQAVDGIIREVTNRDQGKSSAVDFSLFWQVWDRLHEKFVDRDMLDAQKLVYGAISGMVDAAGDPYTTFFEPVSSQKFQEEVSGSFSGVGMEIAKRNGLITVIAPLKDSPAIRAGIKAGDVILKIDDQVTDAMSVEEAVNLIRGRKGTTVRLTIAREGQIEPIVFNVVRDTIRVPAIDWKIINGHIAYLQIYSFNGNVDDEFTQAAKDILASGADRLIVDVRGNPGGLLDASVDIAGWFVTPDSVVVQERFGDGTIQQERAQGTARLASLPTVMLIDGGSASAAEILAGALHDLRAITLIGEKSFGKGSVQQLENFYNGSTLKVTIAKWLTPNGTSISDTGIAPTIEVKMEPKDFQANGWQIGEPGKDPQLDKALEIVSGLR
jgi:carboxyl-terminal processing protease